MRGKYRVIPNDMKSQPTWGRIAQSTVERDMTAYLFKTRSTGNCVSRNSIQRDYSLLDMSNYVNTKEQSQTRP